MAATAVLARLSTPTTTPHNHTAHFASTMAAPEAINITDDGGVTKLVLQAGDGSETPPAGVTAVVNYKGTLTGTETVFDENSGFRFTLGAGEVGHRLC